jgi:membrane protease YdiL (CAAX protease family)
VAAFLVAMTALILTLVRGQLPIDRRFIAATFSLNGFVAILLLLSHRDIQRRIASAVERDPRSVWLVPLPALALYLVYAVGTGSFGTLGFLKIVAYVFLPIVLLRMVRNPEQWLTWQDLLAVLALWLPLDFRWMQDVWVWPRHSLAYSMNSLLATGLAVLLFVCVRHLEGVGYHCHVGKADVWIGIRNFLLFAPLAIPIGLATGFIAISNRQLPFWELPLSALGIFLLIGLPEELLFRGIVQNFLEKTTGRLAVSLVVTSAIFGASHLNNGPGPDWRYFLLASLAGLFYGNAYQRTRGLMAPAIVHTLVDAVWRAFFR